MEVTEVVIELGNDISWETGIYIESGDEYIIW